MLHNHRGAARAWHPSPLAIGFLEFFDIPVWLVGLALLAPVQGLSDVAFSYAFGLWWLVGGAAQWWLVGAFVSAQFPRRGGSALGPTEADADKRASRFRSLWTSGAGRWTAVAHFSFVLGAMIHPYENFIPEEAITDPSIGNPATWWIDVLATGLTREPDPFLLVQLADYPAILLSWLIALRLENPLAFHVRMVGWVVLGTIQWWIVAWVVARVWRRGSPLGGATR